MKLTFIFILLGLMSFASVTYSQSTRLSFESQNVTIENVFKQIEALSEFKFAYNSTKLDVDKKISLKVENQTIDAVLNKILGSANFKYQIVDRYIIITDEDLEGTNSLGNSTQQQKSVTGKVTDNTGAGLPGVSVVVKGTTTGVITDMDGKYTISKVPENAVLQFSFVGMKSQEITVGDKTTLNVTLADETVGIEEVVAVGYGSQSKKKITGSVQNINQKELMDLPTAQISQKLQGKTSGVQIFQNTGKLGGGMSIRIRGAASINAGNQPLYVVDGFPIVGDISSINPDEIESISILKDASSTSLYGSRAANGVVLIQTKKGKDGKTSIQFNSYLGIQSVPQKGRPDMMNARDFFQFEKEVYEEKLAYYGSLGSGDQAAYDYYHKPYSAGDGTNWYDVLLRQAKVESYNLTATTSTEKSSSSVVAGYLNQDGVVINTNYKRYSLRLNSEYSPSRQVKLGFNIAPTYSTNTTSNTDGVLWGGGILQDGILSSPLAPYKNADGSIPLTATSPGLFPNPNWYNVAMQKVNETTTTRILSNAFIEVEFVPGLRFKSTGNVDWSSSRFNGFSPSTVGGIFAPPPQRTSAQINTNTYMSWLTENTLTYAKTLFKDHNINILAGYTSQRYKNDNYELYGIDFPGDQVQTLNAAATTSGSSGINEWSLLSWVGRLNYDYKGKYLLSAAIRRDGSSRFGPNNKWGNFPSVSIGWIVSEEEFMSKIPTVSYLKLRGSYGLTGNNNIGNYSYFAGVNSSNYVFNNTLANGKVISSLGNNDLGWETTSQMDFGFDLGVLKDRILFNYDYFNKTTNNMLFGVAVPRASGFSSIMTNVGEFNFWGHEFTVSSKNLTGKVKWTTDFNISFVKNKVIKLGKTDAPVGGLTGDPFITKVGEPIGQFIGFVFEGVYVNKQDYDSSPKASDSQIGTVKMKDVNGDKVIDDKDRTIIGNPNPKFVYGMTNTLAYQNFDLSFVIAGSYGNKIMNRQFEYTQNLDGVFNVTNDVANRWKSPENPGDGIHPRVNVGTPLARFINSRWVSDGSYLAVKNVTLGYVLPLKANKYVERFRIYGSIQNALMFTKYVGGNPEVSDNGSNPLGQGIDYTAYPVPRTFSLGINLNF